MAFQPQCQACAYVARQLGPDTPCFVHVGRSYFSGADNIYALGDPRPALNRSEEFTLLEHSRLLVLRRRIDRQRRTAARD